jgi:hypothetical protein
METPTLKIEEMSLTDLVTAQKILEEKIEKLRIWMEAMRGRDYIEFERRQVIYFDSPYNDKLEKIDTRIEEIHNLI